MSTTIYMKCSTSSDDIVHTAYGVCVAQKRMKAVAGMYVIIIITRCGRLGYAVCM